MVMGRPSTCTKEMEDKAIEYLNGGWETQDAMPSMVGLCKYIGTARRTIYDWSEREDNNFSYILAEIQSEQERILLNKGLLNEFNSNITKLALGKHGYHERTEVDNKTRIESVKELTPDEAKAISTTLDDKY